MTMIKTGFQNIFPVPIYTTFLDNKIVESMATLITPRLKNLKKTITTYKSDFFEKEKIVSYKELSFFFHHINPIISEYSNKSNINRSNNLIYWVQDYSTNEFHSSHTHGEDLISGVYYVRANDNAGDLRFTNPNPLFNVTDLKDKFRNEINFEIKPKKGLLVLFPGWLLHETLPTLHTDCVRTCLAFNIIK